MLVYGKTMPERAKKSKLTDRFVHTIKWNGGTTYYWDALLPAFGLRVGKKRKTFTIIRGKTRERISIGLYPAINLQEARKRAKALLGTPTHLGGSTPFLDALEQFIELHVSRLKSFAGMERILRKHFSFKKSVHSVTRQDVQLVLDDLSETPSEANHAFKYIRTFFLWCIRRGILEYSPITAMGLPYKEKSRDKLLTPEELVKIWKAATDHPFGTIVRLAILTGQRRGEIQYIELEGDIAVIPSGFTKNGREHRFPVGTLAKELLAHNLTFNGWSKSKARLDKDCGVKGWVLHDLRRAWVSTQASLGTPPHIISALVNHVTEGLTPIQRIYNRHHYLEEMRNAVLLYENHIRDMIKTTHA